MKPFKSFNARGFTHFSISAHFGNKRDTIASTLGQLLSGQLRKGDIPILEAEIGSANESAQPFAGQQEL